MSHSRRRFFILLPLVLALLCTIARADNASTPIGLPVLERPTLHCLGAFWMLRGDDNRNAAIAVDYRKPGEPAWRAGPPMFRVEKGKHQAEKYGSKLDVPNDGWLFAGSVVLLEPDTAYELRFTIKDPDGGEAAHILQARTRAEPVLPANMNTRHVVPGDGGGAGTAADPFKGLQSALGNAKPGDLFLIHAGTYVGAVGLDKKCGTPDKPIALRAAGDGEVILDGQGKDPARAGRVIRASGTSDLFFEGLTIRNAAYGIVVHDATRIVVRRCRIHNVEYGLTATRNTAGNSEDFFIADNVIEGPSVWPRTKGIENARGIQVTGAGHVVCHNRIRGFADAIDTFGSPRVEAIDFHNNDISECTDDGIEMDYSQRNTRCFNNRFTNIFQGVTVQPVFGGPVYIFRNSFYNVCMEPFKIHNSPSGAIFYHNTIVKKGPPLLVYTRAPASNLVMRNNLFIGTDGPYAWECEPKMIDCDFDYDGFGAGAFKLFLKWNGQRYATFDDMRAKSPIEKHATLVPLKGLFASGAMPPGDEKQQQLPAGLQLSPSSAAIDAGQPLPGFNDGFAGKAPDLGAHELGAPLPHYGPRK